MIRTIFRNLISNAIKFSYEGGIVTVEAKMLKDKMKISVSDTGTGIEPKTLKAIFSLDEKVTSTKGTANEKGTGLGLILMQGIC
jgi:signal transduction histidine kinase